MRKSAKFSPEVVERAVRMVFDAKDQHPSQWARVARGSTRASVLRLLAQSGKGLEGAFSYCFGSGNVPRAFAPFPFGGLNATFASFKIHASIFSWCMRSRSKGRTV